MSLSQAEAHALFSRMLDGKMSEGEIRNTLVELADRGESAAEIAGAARTMRERMIKLDGFSHAIDVCGTGGDGQHSLNISTAVSLVVAACEVPVAKHGNRAASSKAGAADTLEALGIDLDCAGSRAAKTLGEIGITFLFAQAHHPAMKYVMPIRKSLGRRTIFNLLGPLANPAGVARQLVGLASPDLVRIYRDAMQMLGMKRAMIVSGLEGLDEISIAGPTRIASIGIEGLGDEVSPEDAGLPRHSLDAIRGGDPEFNAAALQRLLEGEGGAYRDAVLLNSAAALIVAGEADDWAKGVEEAAEAIDKGLAKQLLECWIAATSK